MSASAGGHAPAHKYRLNLEQTNKHAPMDTTMFAIGCGAALAFLILQQILFAFAVMAFVREMRALTAQALDELLTKGQKEIEDRLRLVEDVEARLRRVERRCKASPRASPPERATPRGADERCHHTSSFNGMRPAVLNEIDHDDAWVLPEPARGEGLNTPAQYDRSSSASSATVAPAASGPKASAPARLVPVPERSTALKICNATSAGRVETSRWQRMSSRSQSSLLDGLEGAQAGTALPRAQKRRPGSTPSTPVTRPRDFPTMIGKIRSGTGPVSSGSLFYANVVDRMRREGSA
jgi:hypothetical protein